MCTEYAFTIKQLGKENTAATPSTYDTVYAHWQKYKCHTTFIAYEADSRGICHAHGIISIPKNLYQKKLKVMGFQSYIRPLVDKAGWVKYCEKAQPIRLLSKSLFK